MNRKVTARLMPDCCAGLRCNSAVLVLGWLGASAGGPRQGARAVSGGCLMPSAMPARLCLGRGAAVVALKWRVVTAALIITCITARYLWW